MKKPAHFTDPQRPKEGWLRSHRQSLGLSLQAVADRLDVSPQAVHQFEKSESAGTISLRQLALVARAMGCRVTYAVVRPDAGSRPPAPRRPRAQISAPLSDIPAPVAPSPPASPSIEHSMFLANQESGRFD